jgi:hypothetical protein
VSDYPRSWRHGDPDGASRVLGAPAAVRDGQVLQIVTTVRGYPVQVSEAHDGHHRYLEAEFTVPPTWPLFTLIRDRGEDRPLSSGEITAGWLRLAGVAGCQLWTPDSVRTEQLFARELAEVVARHPLERLRIGRPAASFRSCVGARLNADTARWTLDLIEAILIGAPTYTELGLVDMAPGIAWTQEHLDRDLGITPPDAAG